jgi:hypothetical protein
VPVVAAHELLPGAIMTEHIEVSSRRRRIEDLVMRIEGEFLERPELRLTAAEAQRRFGVDEITCDAVLDALVDAGVLFRPADRVYGRFFPRRFAA